MTIFQLFGKYIYYIYFLEISFRQNIPCELINYNKLLEERSKYKNRLLSRVLNFYFLTTLTTFNDQL
jgi:hypothetical protein